jgi:hypothetical protein
VSEAKRAVIEELEQHLRELLAEVADTRRTINSLCRSLGEKPRYAEEEPSTARATGRPDQYYGKPLASAVREYLDSRGQACAAREILEGLKAGGFDFDAQGWKATDHLRLLASSLAKNTATFLRLPSGTFGLRSWYPNAPKPGKKAQSSTPESVDADADEGQT